MNIPSSDEAPMVPGVDPPLRYAAVPQSTATNARVALGFCGFLAAVVLAGALADVWIYRSLPPGSTISWSMALMGYHAPLAVFVLGFAMGGVIFGLAVHFWNPMPRPEDAQRIAELEAELARTKAGA